MVGPSDLWLFRPFASSPLADSPLARETISDAVSAATVFKSIL